MLLEWLSRRAGIFFLFGCVVANGNPYFLRMQQRVNAVTPAKTNQFPFIVSIFENMVEHVPVRKGVGVILSESIILTGASVLFDQFGNAQLNPKSFVVKYGINEVNPVASSETTRNVKQIVVHKKYSRKTFEADIAFLVLYHSIFGEDASNDANAGLIGRSYSVPQYRSTKYSIGYDKVETGAICRIFGFTSKATLYFAMVEIEDRSLCDDAYRQKKFVLPSDIICAGVPSKDNISSLLDMGGPLLCETKVVAVVSYVRMPGELPGIYTMIGKYKEFIQEALNFELHKMKAVPDSAFSIQISFLILTTTLTHFT